jgi:hypothetical protein
MIIIIIVLREYECEREMVQRWEVNGREGKGWILRGKEDWNLLYINIRRQHKEIHQALFDKGARRRREWEHN